MQEINFIHQIEYASTDNPENEKTTRWLRILASHLAKNTKALAWKSRPLLYS